MENAYQAIEQQSFAEYETETVLFKIDEETVFDTSLATLQLSPKI